jgi:protein-S-isoprenylcysteine O-methyltransferase Ste14
MTEKTDTSGAIVRPPFAWALAMVIAFGLDWLRPLPFLAGSVPRAWAGAVIFASGFALAIWAIATMSRAGTRVETYRPTSAIVTSGPYRFARNPIYVGMFLGQIGLGVGFNSLWFLVTLVPFYLVIRYGVVAREEAYLERKFGDVYLSYKARVRRWL